MIFFTNKIEKIFFYAIVRILFEIHNNSNKKTWRGGRAAECTGLENQQGLIVLRGFKSHPLRQFLFQIPKISQLLYTIINYFLILVVIAIRISYINLNL